MAATCIVHIPLHLARRVEISSTGTVEMFGEAGPLSPAWRHSLQTIPMARIYGTGLAERFNLPLIDHAKAD